MYLVVAPLFLSLGLVTIIFCLRQKKRWGVVGGIAMMVIGLMQTSTMLMAYESKVILGKPYEPNKSTIVGHNPDSRRSHVDQN